MQKMASKNAMFLTEKWPLFAEKGTKSASKTLFFARPCGELNCEPSGSQVLTS
jgi:hypothetical protein